MIEWVMVILITSQNYQVQDKLSLPMSDRDACVAVMVNIEDHTDSGNHVNVFCVPAETAAITSDADLLNPTDWPMD